MFAWVWKQFLRPDTGQGCVAQRFEPTQVGRPQPSEDGEMSRTPIYSATRAGLARDTAQVGEAVVQREAFECDLGTDVEESSVADGREKSLLHHRLGL